MTTPLPAPTEAATKWLIRIAAVFAELVPDILSSLGTAKATRLGDEYYVVEAAGLDALRGTDAAKFIRWMLPLHHSWPCNPQKMDGFIEKAAQTLAKKFGAAQPQALLIGQLQPSARHDYYRRLASNLRGRALQLMPQLADAPEAEAQDPSLPTLFCLVGEQGLFAGVATPHEANGFYPGGTKFIRQSAEETISRAGAKIAEALHYLALHRSPLPQGAHWLELGASPGGMTSELLRRGYRVTAVDRAPLDARLQGDRNLTFARADAASFAPPQGATYDALLSDLNGPALESLSHVIRLVPQLRSGGLVVFTLKAAGAETLEQVDALYRAVLQKAATAGLERIATTHLTYNRQEFTLFFGKR